MILDFLDTGKEVIASFSVLCPFYVEECLPRFAKLVSSTSRF